MGKENNIKEKFKLALISTANAISDDFSIENNKVNNKKIDLFELEKLETRHDFIKYRAESDSSALKKKFSNTEVYKKNLPKNLSYKNLYELSEKTFVEESDSLKQEGAGAGLTDND